MQKEERAMTRLTASDFPPELLELYDFYAHDRISKRDFLVRASGYTVAGLTGAALIAAMSPDYALAQQVQFTDPDILPEYVTYPSPDGHGEVRAYRVAPAGLESPVGGVVVVHENRGLNPYIEDVARRIAKAGFIALAPDGLSSVGGYPGNDDEGRTLQRTVDQEKLLNDFLPPRTICRPILRSTARWAASGSAMAAACATPWRWPSRIWPLQCRSMAGRRARSRFRRSRHRFCCTTPSLMNGLMRAGQPIAMRWTPTPRPIPPISMRAPATASIMIQRRALTKPLRIWRGSARSPSSRNTWSEG
jgi:carboxymethylenebutenolidase